MARSRVAYKHILDWKPYWFLVMSTIPSNHLPALFGISLDNTIGVIILAFTASILLLGILSYQVDHYYQNFRHDNIWIKMLVAFVWFCDIGQSAFQIHALYWSAVTHFGEISAVLNPHWTLKASLLWSAWIYASVQGFLAYRIKILSRYPLIAVACWVGVVARLGYTITASALSLKMPLVEFELLHGSFIRGPLVTGLVVDLLITPILCFSLFDRGRAAIRRTRWLTRNLIVFSIETGIVTMIIGIVALVASYTMPFNGVWVAILFVHSKVYANALLLSLIRRTQLEKTFYSSESITVLQQSSQGSTRVTNTDSTNNVFIEMTRTTKVEFCGGQPTPDKFDDDLSPRKGLPGVGSLGLRVTTNMENQTRRTSGPLTA